MSIALKKLDKLDKDKHDLKKLKYNISTNSKTLVVPIRKNNNIKNKKINLKINLKEFLIKKKIKFNNVTKPKSQNNSKKEKKKKRKSKYEQVKVFSNFIKKAGFDFEFKDLNNKFLIITGIIIVLFTIILSIKFFIIKALISDIITGFFSLWSIGMIFIFLSLWIGFFVFIDLRIFQRRKELEEVFPDYLQLTAANISSGMPIDRALWYAIRPRFGILAKEMEEVAKATLVGEKLSDALINFSEKYDSVVIKRSFNLLLEGLNSGGEVGDLLRRIANNMKETEIIKKEMASSVTTYVIFILFATLGAAPFLFGLTTVLIVIMTKIFTNIDLGGGGGGMGGLLSGGANIISLKDYQTFVVVSIVMSSIFASIIISVIQKGNAKEAIKNLPLYIPIGLANYFVSYSLLNYMLSGLF